MMFIKQGCCYFQSLHFSYMLQEDSVQNSRHCSSSPLHLFGRRDILSGHSFVKHHPSGRWELSVRTPFCVQKLRTVLGYIRSDVSATRLDAFQCSTSKMISFSKHRYRKTAATVQTAWYSVRTLSLIRQVVQKTFNRSDVVCSRSTTIRMLGQHRPDAALFRKEYQQIWKAGCTIVRLNALSYHPNVA